MVGFTVYVGDVDSITPCRMFSRAICGESIEILTQSDVQYMKIFDNMALMLPIHKIRKHGVIAGA